MILTRLATEDSTDTMPTIPSGRFADPRLEHCGDTDRELIEETLLQLGDLIYSAAAAIGKYPDQRRLQASFVTLVGQRDALEMHLVRIA